MGESRPGWTKTHASPLRHDPRAKNLQMTAGDGCGCVRGAAEAEAEVDADAESGFAVVDNNDDDDDDVVVVCFKSCEKVQELPLRHRPAWKNLHGAGGRVPR
jgi:hypothetical protein